MLGWGGVGGAAVGTWLACVCSLAWAWGGAQRALPWGPSAVAARAHASAARCVQDAAGGMFVYGGSVSLDGSTIVSCSGTAQTNVRSAGRRVCWVGEGWGVRPSARGWRACAAWRGRGVVRSGHCPGARVQ